MKYIVYEDYTFIDRTLSVAKVFRETDKTYRTDPEENKFGRTRVVRKMQVLHIATSKARALAIQEAIRVAHRKYQDAKATAKEQYHSQLDAIIASGKKLEDK